VQACADDPQVVHHAVRTLSRLGHGSLRPRWLQSGFLPRPDGATPRNLFGFADGTANISGRDAATLDRHVWVGGDDDTWMRGGSYLVVRRVRMRLEEWDSSSLREQENAIGRSKTTGLRLATAAHGHATLARPESNGGVRLLRRGYAYAGELDVEGRLDAGLLFLAYQRDPRKQFVRIQQLLAAHDAMNEYVTHVGSAVFACPPGLAGSTTWGDQLRELATATT
jgi:deferrochelatase/peroxidase EfeB